MARAGGKIWGLPEVVPERGVTAKGPKGPARERTRVSRREEGGN